MAQRKKFSQGQWIGSIVAVIVVVVLIVLALRATDSRRIATFVASEKSSPSPAAQPAGTGACFFRTDRSLLEVTGDGCKDGVTQKECLQGLEGSFYRNRRCPASDQCGKLIFLASGFREGVEDLVIECVHLTDAAAQAKLLELFKSRAKQICTAAHGSQCGGDVRFHLGPTLLSYVVGRDPVLIPSLGLAPPIPDPRQYCFAEFEAWFTCQPTAN